MKYLNKTEITSLNMDINNICNVACPGCARQDRIDGRNLHLDKPKSISFDVWKKVIDELGPQLINITFCGNYGDAAATNNLPELIQYAIDVNKNIRFNVVSHMSINTVDYWIRLGNLPTKNLTIQCSLDGLSDTNHIYRRFANWHKIMTNVAALRTTHARMIWKFIEFPWNRHQIDTARLLSKEMGFHKFIVTRNNANDIRSNRFFNKYVKHQKDWHDFKSFKNTTYKHPDIQSLDGKQSWDKLLANKKQYDSIECYTQNEQSIHIDWDGDVYPCCWMGASKCHPDSNVIAMHQHITQPYQDQWNNLQHHSVEDIMNHPYYTTDLMNSLDTKPSAICAESCGQCNGKFNTINTIGKENK
jgi:MoaA/NifB/PqqE/SkfB family radical SAM enzyme